MSENLTNWAGNVTFNPTAVHRPTSVSEVQALVAASRRLRVLGSGHSFSPVVDTEGDLVSVAGLPAVIDVDQMARTARVSAGLRYGDLVGALEASGLALRTMGSLPHISVAGTCATGTHGSGVTNQVLGAAVRAMTLITAQGEVLHLDRSTHPEVFDGAVVALGTLGVVVDVTLDLVPSYELSQRVFENLPWAELESGLDEILSAAYSVSLFTGWQSPVIEQVWLKERIDGIAGTGPALGETQWRGATAAPVALHPVPGMSAEACTEQLGRPGPWFARLPHFRLEFTPSSGEELQTEYFVDRVNALEALRAVAALAARIGPVLQISEIRTVAADTLWLSPAQGRDSLAIHFTWIADLEAVLPVLRDVERALSPFEPRPHWGKVFRIDPAAVSARYERLEDFAALRADLDPQRVFANPFVDAYLGAV